MGGFLDAWERESASDIKHWGVKGMRWGVINKSELKGGMAGGIRRGMQYSNANIGRMEPYELRDQVDQMRLESDYRKLVEERATYGAVQAQKIKEAKRAKILAVAGGVAAAVSFAGGVLKIVSSLGGHPEKWLTSKKQQNEEFLDKASEWERAKEKEERNNAKKEAKASNERMDKENAQKYSRDKGDFRYAFETHKTNRSEADQKSFVEKMQSKLADMQSRGHGIGYAVDQKTGHVYRKK